MESPRAQDGIGDAISGSGVQITIRRLHDELVQLFEERTRIVRRMDAAKRTIGGLVMLFGESVLDDTLRELMGKGSPSRQPGLTKMVRTVLMEAQGALSSRDVLSQVTARNPSLLAGHKDPLASLTTILNRLVNYGEAKRVCTNGNRQAWQWSADLERQPQV